MHSNSIHISLAKHCINQIAVAQAVKLLHMRKIALLMLRKKLFRLRRCLHSDKLALEIRELVNRAVLVHCHSLSADKIRTSPIIQLLTSAHRKRTPQAVKLATLKQIILIRPVDIFKLDIVAHAAAGLLRQLHINTCRLAVLIDKIERRIEITAHNQLLSSVVIAIACLALLHTAARQQGRQQQARSQGHEYFFLPPSKHNIIPQNFLT